MNKVTFGFIVGGDDQYYTNLMRACESLERVKQDHEVLIIDMDCLLYTSPSPRD